MEKYTTQYKQRLHDIENAIYAFTAKPNRRTAKILSDLKNTPISREETFTPEYIKYLDSEAQKNSKLLKMTLREMEKITKSWAKRRVV